MKKTNYLGLLPLILLTLTIISCEKDDFEITETSQSSIEETDVQSTNTILGKKLQIPFEVKNVQKAMENLSENRTSTLAKSKLQGRNPYQIETTHYYYRFLPKDSIEYNTLINDNVLSVSDTPFEYEIQTQGERYLDPTLIDTTFTYYYSVVPKNYQIPSSIQNLKIADLHFTAEDEIGPNPTQAELEQLDIMYDVNLEAMKTSNNLSQQEKQELKYFPKDGSLNYSISFQQAQNLGYALDDLIIDFSEIEPQERRQSWNPSGTLTVREDVINRNVGISGAFVKVRKWGWLVIKTATTNTNGYFQTSSTRTKHVKYSVFFRHDPLFTVKAGTIFWDARHLSYTDYSRQPWNENFTGGHTQFYAQVHNAANDYYTRIVNQYGLRMPHYSMKISAKWDLCGSSQHRAEILTLLPISEIRITRRQEGCVNRNSDGIYATTIHELTHAGHRQMDTGMFSIFESGSCNRAVLIESWAEGVESIVSNDRHNTLTNNSYHSSQNGDLGGRWNLFRQRQTAAQMNEYTPIVEDLIDNLNQNLLPNLPGEQPIDRVNGYTLNQIQTALNNCRDIVSWENNLRNYYNNTTENNLFELFGYVKVVRGNLNSPCN